MKTPPGKTPEDVVADYLGQLYKQMMANLERNISAAILQVTPISPWSARTADHGPGPYLVRDRRGSPPCQSKSRCVSAPMVVLL